jgi:hypothetical protein
VYKGHVFDPIQTAKRGDSTFHKKQFHVKSTIFMVKSAKRRIGDIGEDIVCKYLQNKGYVVRERNYWRPWGEIDIIAEKPEFISFVEVKSVSKRGGAGEFSQETVRPEENMHPRVRVSGLRVPSR